MNDTQQKDPEKQPLTLEQIHDGLVESIANNKAQRDALEKEIKRSETILKTVKKQLES